MAKKEDGIGFRDLHGFNLALLGKHCWNFLHNPSSLVSRVFKSRYFLTICCLKLVEGEVQVISGQASGKKKRY